jgi:hypothetical protein
MYDVIRAIHNAEFDVNMTWKYSDEVYNNQFVGHLTALLALARVVNDKPRFTAVLDGGAGTGTVKLPWPQLFDHVMSACGTKRISSRDFLKAPNRAGLFFTGVAEPYRVKESPKRRAMA